MRIRWLVPLFLVAAVATAHADKATRNFAGSIQLDYLASPTDENLRQNTFDGATVELSLKMSMDITKNVSANVKVCYACHGFETSMAYIDMRVADELNFRVGRMTPSFGSFPLRADPANHHTSDKPLPYDMGRMLHYTDFNEGVLPAPWVDNGIEINGTHFFHGGQVEYAIYAIGGPKGSSDAADFDFTLSHSGAAYYVDNNDEPTVGGRVATTLELGDETTLTAGASYMGGTYDPNRHLGFEIGGADVVLSSHGAALRAEYLIRKTDMFLSDDPAARFKYGPGPNGKYSDYFVKDGFYVEGEVPVGRFDLIARWDGLRRSGNVLATSLLRSESEVLRYTLGTALRLRSGIRLKLSGEYYNFTDFKNEVAIHVGIAMPF